MFTLLYLYILGFYLWAFINIRRCFTLLVCVYDLIRSTGYATVVHFNQSYWLQLLLFVAIDVSTYTTTCILAAYWSLNVACSFFIQSLAAYHSNCINSLLYTYTHLFLISAVRATYISDPFSNRITCFLCWVPTVLFTSRSVHYRFCIASPLSFFARSNNDPLSSNWFQFITFITFCYCCKRMFGWLIAEC